VEQRQAVHEPVLGAPGPGLGEGVQARLDGAVGELDALGAARGAAGVHDERDGVRGRRRKPGGRLPGHVHGHGGGVAVRAVAERQRRAGVAQDVLPLGRSGVGRHGHHRGPAEQGSGDRDDGLEGSRGVDGDGVRAVDIGGDRPGGIE
jgi:hypothetical protein